MAESLSQRMRDALRDFGPMTAAEICESVGVAHVTSGRLVSAMRHRGQVHITAWTREAIGERNYPRAIYTLGAGEDAKRIRKLGQRAADAKSYRAKKQRVNSVFALGGRA